MICRERMRASRHVLCELHSGLSQFIVKRLHLGNTLGKRLGGNLNYLSLGHQWANSWHGQV